VNAQREPFFLMIFLLLRMSMPFVVSSKPFFQLFFAGFSGLLESRSIIINKINPITKVCIIFQFQMKI